MGCGYMKKVDFDFIRKYVVSADCDLMLVEYVEEENMYKIWVVRIPPHGICPECGKMLDYGGSDLEDYVVEDIPIYGKRVNLILCDSNRLKSCTCIDKDVKYHVSEKKGFDIISHSYTTSRYLEYMLLMGGNNPCISTVFSIIKYGVTSYTDSRMFIELTRSAGAYSRLIFIMRDFIILLNGIKFKYADTDFNYTEYDNTGITKFAREVMISDNFIEEVAQRMQKKLWSEYNTEFGAMAWDLFASGYGFKDIVNKISFITGDYPKAYTAVSKIYGVNAFIELAKNNAVYDGHEYKLNLSILKDGYDAYMKYLDDYQVPDNIFINERGMKSDHVVESLKYIGYETLYYKESDGNTNMVIVDKHDVPSEAGYISYKSYVRRINIGDSHYQIKVLFRPTYCKPEGNRKRKVHLKQINGVSLVKSGGGLRYSWDIREVDRVASNKDRVYGFSCDEINNKDVSTDMIILWLYKMNSKMTYVKHDKHGDTVRVYVVHDNGGIKCPVCGSVDVLKIPKEYSFMAGELNYNKMEITVTNHSICKCSRDNTIFQTKYTR